MKALILRKNVTAAISCAQALMEKGFHIAYSETQVFARELIKADTIDLLVMDETIGGRLTHALAHSVERRNPYVSVIMATDRTGSETDELYDLIPCLYGLVGTDSSGPLISQLAIASTETYDEAAARIRRNAALVAEDEDFEDSDADLQRAYAEMMGNGATAGQQAGAETEELDVLTAVSRLAAALPAPPMAPQGEASVLAESDAAAAHNEAGQVPDQTDAEARADLAFEQTERSVRADGSNAYAAFDEVQFAALTASHSFIQPSTGLRAEDPMMKIAVGA